MPRYTLAPCKYITFVFSLSTTKPKFLLSTSGEGFGIPIIEAMACEVPVLATDYTTTQELVKDTHAGLGINLSGCGEINAWDYDTKEYGKMVLDGTMTGTWEVERGFCSIDDAVRKLKWMSDNQSELKLMGKNGRIAVLNEYDFEKVGTKWDKLLE